MKEVKEKAIELLLDIISKEDFEMMLYEKVKSEDLIKNKLLFDLVNINYRKENFKRPLLEILEKIISQETFIIYKVKLHSDRIKDENNSKIIRDNFSKIYGLFEYDKEYSLMWDFYHINVRMDLAEIGYEEESKVINDLKLLCFKIGEEFEMFNLIEEKVDFLVNGFQNENSLNSKEHKPVTKENKTQKKWFEFWK